MVRLPMLVVLLACATSRADSGADFAEAKALNAKGRAMLDAGDPGGALAVFERAYDRSPSPALLLNIGTSFKRLGRNAEAANAYQRYLDDPGADSARASEVRTLVVVLDTTVGKLAIAAPPAAEVQINDGKWMPAGEAHVLRVEPGTYVVRARQGDQRTEIAGRIDAGEQRSHTLAPSPAAQPASALVTPAAPRTTEIVREPPRRAGRVVAPFVGGAGVLAATGGLLFALRSQRRFAEARDLCGDGCEQPAYDQARARSDAARTDRLWSVSLFVVGAAAVVTGGYLWSRPRTDTRPMLTVRVGTGEVGVVMAGRF